MLNHNAPQYVKLSGEGEQGTFERAAAKTVLGLQREIRREKCNGDRWARGYVLTDAANFLYRNIDNNDSEMILPEWIM